MAVGLLDTYTPAVDDDTGRCPADLSSDDLVDITRHMTMPMIAAMMIVATIAPTMMPRNIRSSVVDPGAVVVVGIGYGEAALLW